jgi:hypothetical protein
MGTGSALKKLHVTSFVDVLRFPRWWKLNDCDIVVLDVFLNARFCLTFDLFVFVFVGHFCWALEPECSVQSAECRVPEFQSAECRVQSSRVFWALGGHLWALGVLFGPLGVLFGPLGVLWGP